MAFRASVATASCVRAAGLRRCCCSARWAAGGASRAGTIYLWKGRDAPVVANVLEGVLKVATAAAVGREQIVGIVFPSDLIGQPFGQESPQMVWTSRARRTRIGWTRSRRAPPSAPLRPEEHTSEIQSLMRYS